jgi:hypothetical protein
MTTVKEMIWRSLGQQGKSYDIHPSDSKTYLITATSQHVIVQKPPKWRYSSSSDNKSSELVLDYDLTNQTFGLYQDWEVPEIVLLSFGEALNVELPIYDVKDGMVGVMTPNVKRFPKVINVPKVESNREYTYFSYPTLDFPNGETLVEGNHIRVHNDTVERFTQATLTSWVPTYLKKKLKLENGEEVEIVSSNYKWWLCKAKKVGDKRVIRYPVNLDGTIVEDELADNYWAYFGDNSKNRIDRYICEGTFDLSEDFDREVVSYHFYGKNFDGDQLEAYFDIMAENGGICPCPRCQGFTVFKREKGIAPYYRGWTMEHYKAMHAGINGSLPTDRELLKDCTCKACKSFRNTRDRKESYLRKKFKTKFEEKKYSNNEIQYATGGWKADPQIYPDEVPSIANMSVDDWLWRPKSTWFKGLFSDNNKSSPMYFENIPIRYKLAFIHCRLTLVEWKDTPAEAAKWLTEVYNTQFEPFCNCKLCTELKTNPDMLITIANELLMENVNPAVYTTAIFNIHFQENYWSSNSIKTKQQYIDYFNKYILYGKYCECEKCKKFMSKIGDSEYLPPEELAAPKCPLCGGRVHNKDLIYQNKEIAKAVIQKGASRLIGVRTALCCGCYNKFRVDRARRQAILDMKVGASFQAEIRGEAREDGSLFGMRRRRIREVWDEEIEKEDREPGTGTLMIGEYLVPDFVSLNNITLKLPQAVEDAFAIRDS